MVLAQLPDGVSLRVLGTFPSDIPGIEEMKLMELAEDGQVLDQGKYIVIWKQEAGQWKMHHDIFNTSMPAPE